MNHSIPSEAPQLRTTAGDTVTLQSVHLDGRLDGLMLVMKTRQAYRNDGPGNLEVVYTFPLPWGATLLALNAEIAGQRLAGTVLEKKQASARYEKAIDDGDTPIMVEQSAQGLYTANLGNLKPGEDAVIEIEHAQLLRLEQGQIRITVPTTVAPRYGHAHGEGGLAAHESVASSLAAQYPLTLQILLTGDVAHATVSCPTHAIASHAGADGVRVSLARGAFLDRDLVLLLDGLRGASFATVVPDGDAFAVLASFCPEAAPASGSPLRLKLLVDCSGSMAGDSIGAARRALHELLQALGPSDQISYSRFGSEVQHGLAGLQRCDAATIRTVADLVARTDADLGGTEMNAALLSTFALGTTGSGGAVQPDAADAERPTDVLLITDGDIWGVDDLLRNARESAHRVFAIGVGSSPAESLLRELAEQTGGACELVSPNQDIAAVILRMFRRLRAPQVAGVRVDWGQPAVWQSEPSQFLFEGDTVHAFARLPQRPARPPVLSWRVADTRAEAPAARVDADTGTTVSRMVGAAQRASLLGLARTAAHPEQARWEGEALQLALRYQLVTDQTHLILVHVRDEAHKAVGLPELAQITSMQAAGWGGSGTVIAYSARMPQQVGADLAAGFGALCVEPMMAPSYSAHARAIPSGPEDVWASLSEPAGAACDRTFERPSFQTRDDAPTVLVGTTVPAELLRRFEASVRGLAGTLVWSLHLDALSVPQQLADLIEAMAQELGTREQAWGVVLHWLQQVLPAEPALSRQAARIVRASIQPVDPAALLCWTYRLTQSIGPVRGEAWGAAHAAA
jgi:Ca-activated chloride channel family protein